jgi:hypothetical protein
MGRSVSWETKQKLFSYEISLRNPWAAHVQAENYSLCVHHSAQG